MTKDYQLNKKNHLDILPQRLLSSKTKIKKGSLLSDKDSLLSDDQKSYCSLPKLTEFQLCKVIRVRGALPSKLSQELSKSRSDLVTKLDQLQLVQLLPTL